MKALNLSLLLFVIFSSVAKGETQFWQSQSSPQSVGEKLIEDLLSREDYMMYVTDHFTGIHYAEAAMGYGAMKLLQHTENADLLEQVKQRYRDVPGTDRLIEAGHVDANVYGIVPLQLYMLTGNKESYQEGIALADAQWDNPRDDGLSAQTRFWIDDIWMINSLQVQAFRATDKVKYLDRAAMQTEIYLKRLQQANGLFYHGPEAHFFWGRGNGWVAAGLAELLSVLPKDHSRYRSIETGYLKMMSALLEYQAEDGMWRQLIDKPQSWKESSSTAMFGFALAVGVKHGILPEENYRPAYQRAWLALNQRIDDSGQLEDVCVGTGQSQDIDYYLDRPRTTGDFHGQAPTLWFAEALLSIYNFRGN